MIKCVAIRVQMCQCAIGAHRYVFAKLSQSMINNNERKNSTQAHIDYILSYIRV